MTSTRDWNQEKIQSYQKYMLYCQLLRDPEEEQDLEEISTELAFDLAILQKLRKTRYLNGKSTVPKAGSLHLAWEFAKNEDHHTRFINMLRVSPMVFEVLLTLIKDNPVFANNSNNPQTPVDLQLAVTLYRLGRYGNAASIEEIARNAGFSEGAVQDFTDRCFTAILTLHDRFVRRLTDEEKEAEKVWVEEYLGIQGCGLLWREGYLMYDGTIVVLYAKPSLHGEGYYTRKANYGLNVQIGNVASNLRIIDYSHGHTGSAHDANAFEHTCAFKDPAWLFQGEEFAWADSAYPISTHVIPIHRQPASNEPHNRFFDEIVSHLRVRSEHCMGALKGRFQCLRGLRVGINTMKDHTAAGRWISVCIVLHNLIIEVEGAGSMQQFFEDSSEAPHEQNGAEESEQGGPDVHNAEGERKREHLINEIIQHYAEQQ